MSGRFFLVTLLVLLSAARSQAEDCAETISAHAYLLRAQPVCGMTRYGRVFFQQARVCRDRLGLERFIEDTRRGLEAADGDLQQASDSASWCRSVQARFEGKLRPDSVPLSAPPRETGADGNSAPTSASELTRLSCAEGSVHGLDPSGDGFLAVRKEPASSSRMVDKLVNGDSVYVCGARGGWMRVVYPLASECLGKLGSRNEGATPIRCSSGWAHGHWINRPRGSRGAKRAPTT